MANIEIGGRLHSTATGNVVTGANEVLDDAKNKKQSVINAEVDETIGDDNTEGTIKGRIKTAEGKLDTLNGDSSTSGSVAKAVADAKTELIGGATSDGNTLKKVEDRTATLETAVGSNGSVDQRIAAAKSEVIGDAASDYNTLGKLEDKIQAEASARESAVSTEAQARQDAITAETNRATTRENQIYDLIHTPEQHYVTVATYADLANIASPSDDTIYRVSSYNGNTSQVDNTVYSEYGYDGTNFVFLCVKSQIDEVYDISAHHSNNTYVDLAAALDGGNNIPQELRKGGMSVKFVQSSDNNYIRCNLLAQEFTTDVTQWAIDDVGVYVENPEYIDVKTDVNGKILWAIKADGSIYWGVGVPQQVIDYVAEKIAELSLDEYEDIVTFLGNLIEGDTLAALLNGKVNVVEGKSLIDAEYASSQEVVENPEWSQVTTDSEGKILEGIEKSRKVFNIPVSFNSTVDLEGATIQYIQNPEYISIVVDKNNRIIEAIRKDGEVISFGTSQDTDISELTDKVEEINQIIDSNLPFKSLKGKFCPGKMLNKANVGDTIDITDIEDNSEGSVGFYLIEPCKANDIFKIKGEAGEEWRLLSFVSADYKLIWQSANVYMNNVIVSAPQDGYIIVNVGYSNYQFDLQKKSRTFVEGVENAWELKGLSIPSSYVPTQGSWHSMAADSGNDFTINSSVAEIYALYDELVETYPSYITKYDLGMDESNTYHIYNYVFKPQNLRLGYNTFTPKTLPRLLLMGGIHGLGFRGDVNVMKGALYYFLKDVCENYANNEALEFFRENVIFDVVPIINPWGHENQMKLNGVPFDNWPNGVHFSASRCNSNGVDLNRNSQYYWHYTPETVELQGVTCPNWTYAGKFPLSEAESKIWFNWAHSHQDAVFFFDIHAVGNDDGKGYAQQSDMMYSDGWTGDNYYYIMQSAVKKISHAWSKLGIDGLLNVDTNGNPYQHGRYDDGRGDGHASIGVRIMGIDAGIFEGFSNFNGHGSGVVDYGDDIMHMLQLYIGNVFLCVLTSVSNNN